jgi:tol-pal system protein YbgF
VGKLQYDLIQLRSDVRNIKTQIPGQKGELNERLQNLEEQQKATSKAVSDLLIKVQSLTTELRILTGRFDEAQYFSEKSSKELTESKDTLIAQIKGLEVAVNELKEKLARLESAEIPFKKQNPYEKAEKAEEQTSKELKESRSLGTAKEVKDIYMEAYKIFKENKFTDAREKFEALLEDYPENEYSDNARFWIGESYYKEKNYAEAILAYDELLKKNPESNKVPGAYLKQALAFYELKEEELGKITLEILIEKFPDSEQAKIAEKKLSPPIPVKKN